MEISKDYKKMFELIRVITNRLASIADAFPEDHEYLNFVVDQDDNEITIDGYKVEMGSTITIYLSEGSSIYITGIQNGGCRVDFYGVYEDNFRLIKYNKSVYFDDEPVMTEDDDFKFILEHDMTIFIPLFTVAKNITQLVKLCKEAIKVDIQEKMQVVNRAKRQLDMMERLSNYFNGDEYLQEING